MATPKQTDPQFKLRFTPELRDQIEAAAKANNRSMNAEIVARLEEFPRLRQVRAASLKDRARLADDKERLEWELEQLAAVKQRFFEKDGSPKPVLSIPQSLLDRIRLSAVQNHRTVDAEAIAALESAFPPKSIDLDILASFLDTLVMPFADEEGRAEYDQYIEEINDLLSKLGARWTVKSDPLGQVAFYPYQSPKKSSDEEGSE